MAKANLPTVLITGSSGFLGRAIAQGLQERYRVIGLDVSQPRNPLEGMDTIEIDLTSDESVDRALEEVASRAGERIASVIHLAAYYDTTGEDNPKYDAVTVQGTRRLLAALQDLQTEQFVFSSTLLVHAPSPEKGVKIDENSPVDPPWAYPKSKAETEQLIARERQGIKTAVLRLAGVYDEDCHAAFIAQQIARIFERRPTAYLFTGDLSSGQPYLHKDDLVEAVVRTVDRRDQLPDETVLLIGEEETPSYEDMQKRIGRLVHDEDWHTLTLPKGLTAAGSWVQTEVLEEDTEILPWTIENSDDHLWRAKKAGEPFWRTFWRGGSALSEDQTPEPDLDRSAASLLRDFITGGVNFPWTLVASALLGALLMTTPLVFGTEPPLYFSDHIIGCLVIMVAVTAIAEVVRPVRFLNVVFGVWIVASPFVLAGGTTASMVGDVVIGMALIGLSLPRGTRSDEHYGGWDKAIV